MTDFPSYNIHKVDCETMQNKDFEVYRLQEVKDDLGKLNFPHKHIYYTIIYIESGKGSHQIDFKEYPLENNTIYFLSPGQIHNWNIEELPKGYALFFTEEFFALNCKNHNVSDFDFFHLQKINASLKIGNTETNTLLLDLFEKLITEFQQNQPYAQRIIRSYTVALLFTLQRIYSQTKLLKGTSKNISLIKEFDRLVNEHYLTKRSVKEYAELLHITPNHLNAVCTKVYGHSAGEHIRNRIMIEAKRLLVNMPGVTVAEIAYRLNFDDNAYFSRFFKKYAGETPEKFRKRRLSKEQI
jgi:AraC-like DNA-binding protein